jgi:HAD superfamily hydrolase (TIGR01509 family)
MPDLVIFDCDGVLVDSEPISIGVLLEGLGEAGVAISEEVAYRRFLGRSVASIVGTIQEEFGLVVTDRHLSEMRARLHERFQRELQPIPEVGWAIDNIGTLSCVASSSQPERIRLSLSITGLIERLEPRIFSASMVKNGKPAPDLFLHAARTMGVDPSGCVVIEDSTAGIEAAKRAGMRVFAFAGGSHAPLCGLREAAAALDPDLIFDDMRQLPGLVASLR